MTISEKKILEIIKYLALQISLGWNHLRISQFIEIAEKQNKIKGAHIILHNAKIACWDFAVLSLAKIVETHHDSINIYYLFNCIENNLNLFPYIDRDTLIKHLDIHGRKLNDIDPILLDKLFLERDKIVSHLDRKLVNQPDIFLSKHRITSNELEFIYNVLRLILVYYDKAFSTFSFWNDESETIRKDLEYLLNSL